MRTPIASDLISRDGTLQRDAGTKNAVIEVQGEVSAVLKRPGVVSSEFNYSTPIHGVASLAEIIGNQKYKSYSQLFDNASTVILTICNDSFVISQAWPSLFDPEKTYQIGDVIWYAIGAYDTTANGGAGDWVPDAEMPPASEWKPYYSYCQSIKTPPDLAGAGGSFWKRISPPLTRFQANADGNTGGVAATKDAAAHSAFASVRKSCAGVVGQTFYPSGFTISGNYMYADQWATVTGNCADAASGGQVIVGTIYSL